MSDEKNIQPINETGQAQAPRPIIDSHKEYARSLRRLPGRSKKFASMRRTRLFLAPDHMLYLTRKPYSETSKRFYFNEIQAIAITQTSARRNMNIILSTVTVLLAVLVAWGFGFGAAFDIDQDFIILIIIVSPFLIALIINNALGPTCVTKLHTAVQIEELESLRRLRAAHKSINVIRQQIEAVQGQMTPQMLDNSLIGEGAIEASKHEIDLKRDEAARKEISPRVYSSLFYILIILGLGSPLDMILQESLESFVYFKNLVDSMLFLAAIVLAFIGIVSYHNSKLPSTLYPSERPRFLKNLNRLAITTYIAIAMLLIYFIFIKLGSIMIPGLFWTQRTPPAGLPITGLAFLAPAVAGLIFLSQLKDMLAAAFPVDSDTDSETDSDQNAPIGEK